VAQLAILISLNSPSLEESGHDRHHSGQQLVAVIYLLGLCAVLRDFDINALYGNELPEIASWWKNMLTQQL
jgi:hypothetical protein